MGGAGTLRHPELGQRVKGVQLSPAESSSRHDGEVVQTSVAVFLLIRIRMPVRWSRWKPGLCYLDLQTEIMNFS